VPPYVKAQRMENVDAMSNAFPGKSTFLSRSMVVPSRFHSTCKKRINNIKAAPPRGKLRYNIHLHVALSVNNAPMKGPIVVPILMVRNRKPIKAARSRMGTRSHMIMSISILIPPAPVPCAARAAINMFIEFAPPHSPLPSTKRQVVPIIT
jgi:hypothetical protein